MAKSELEFSRPEFAMLVATRVMLGLGLGFLLAEQVDVKQRRAIGGTLFLVGVLSTIPFAFQVLGGRRLAAGAAADSAGTEEMPKGEVAA
jgi:hypothetical protein